MNPYEELASAIILSAVKDYRRALRVHMVSPYGTCAKRDMDKCEQFFLSDWYKALTGVDGELLVQRLRQEVLE